MYNVSLCNISELVWAELECIIETLYSLNPKAEKFPFSTYIIVLDNHEIYSYT